MARGECPVTRDEFEEHAKDGVCTVNGQPFLAKPKEPKDGKSLGWYGQAKVTMEVNGKQVECQVGINITAIHSK